MGEVTGIQWTDHTFNPWIGCQRVSPGCVNCYAEHRNAFVRIQRKQGRELWGPKGDRHITSDGNWNKPHVWNRAAQDAGKAARVFCASLADVFEDRRDLDAPRARLFGLIEATAFLDWQLLTKRTEAIARLVPLKWMDHGFPSNVWIGTSVEDQPRADERIPHLVQLPARIRFLSCEPLIEGVNLDLTGIHWVIVGGESGSGAREFDVDWARSIIGQCRGSRVACFVKQLGARVITRNDDGFSDDGIDGGWPGFPETRDTPGSPGWQGDPVRVLLNDSHGGDISEWPEDLRVREFPQPGSQLPTDIELEEAGQINLIDIIAVVNG